MNRHKKLEKLAWRCLVAGFDGMELSKDFNRILVSGVGGVILFKRNIGSQKQLVELIKSIRSASAGNVLLTVDQEGGRVARLEGIVSEIPSMRTVSLTGAENVEKLGYIVGMELSSLGFDIVHAPVADVDTNPANPVIGDRSFSSCPHETAELACAYVRGVQSANLAACGKHFPGHGDTDIDSHIDLPRIPHDRKRLEEIELLPFSALSRCGTATMMTAHIVVEKLDPEVPATMSPAVIGILRNELSFKGLIMTDDMEMNAITEKFSIGDAALRAISAGCDMILVCHKAERQEEVVEAITKGVMDKRLCLNRLEDAVKRINNLSMNFSPERRRPSTDILNNIENQNFISSLFENKYS